MKAYAISVIFDFTVSRSIYVVGGRKTEKLELVEIALKRSHPPQQHQYTHKRSNKGFLSHSISVLQAAEYVCCISILVNSYIYVFPQRGITTHEQ